MNKRIYKLWIRLGRDSEATKFYEIRQWQRFYDWQWETRDAEY